jgi:malate dehydrogenase (oxaloacetate-decarboxylating)(NADP+)
VKVSQARKITEDMFYVAAQALANCVTAEEFEKGQVYPDITRIRYVSQEVAFRVADLVFNERNTPLERPANLREKITKTMYYPFYAPLVPRPK